MDNQLVLLCALALVTCASGYKIVIFVPTLSNSQVLLNYRLGELIAAAGHEVTLYRPQYNADVKKGRAKLAKEVRFPTGVEKDFKTLNDVMQEDIFHSSSVTTVSYERMKQWTLLMSKACQAQFQNKEAIEALKGHDLAIVHPYDFCPFGLIHLAGIPTYIWMSSTILTDFMAIIAGVPNPPSFVPNVMSASTDHMTFPQRVKNAIGYVMTYIFVYRLSVNPTTALFREEFGQEFPDVGQLAGDSPLIFVNSEQLLDFPRPILHKTVYIGGFFNQTPSALTPEYQKLMDSSKDGVVLMSFGSVANGSAMPLEWKKAFIESFARFPTYTFVWKYELDVFDEAKACKNLHLSKWVPQKDMFGHPKMKGFITHGGYNSFIESAFNGIPSIPIPLFGDQYGTAVRGKRHGFAHPLDKAHITADTISVALDAILHDPTYAANAQRVSSMLRKKPVKAKDLIVNWVEFLAEHKELPNLVPASQDLNIFQYFLLDVFGFLLLILLGLIYVLLKVIKLYVWWCCYSNKYKKD